MSIKGLSKKRTSAKTWGYIINYKTLFSKLKIKKIRASKWLSGCRYSPLPQPEEFEGIPGAHRRCKERISSTNSDLKVCSVAHKPLPLHSITTNNNNKNNNNKYSNSIHNFPSPSRLRLGISMFFSMFIHDFTYVIFLWLHNTLLYTQNMHFYMII